MKIFGVFAIAALSVVGALSSTAEEGIQIVIPSHYIGADPVQTGDGWWGIFRVADGFTLRATSIHVETTTYQGQDSGDEMTDVSIKTTDASFCVAAVRGLVDIRSGQLEAIQEPEQGWPFQYIGQKIEVSLNRRGQDPRTYIAALGTAEQAPGVTYIELAHYRLNLFTEFGRDKIIQTIVDLPDCGGDGPKLLWAGDLDRDGKLDLLYDLATIYVDTHAALFLSSAAKDGELVGLVAEWHAASNC